MGQGVPQSRIPRGIAHIPDRGDRDRARAGARGGQFEAERVGVVIEGQDGILVIGQAQDLDRTELTDQFIGGHKRALQALTGQGGDIQTQGAFADIDPGLQIGVVAEGARGHLLDRREPVGIGHKMNQGILIDPQNRDTAGIPSKPTSASDPVTRSTSPSSSTMAPPSLARIA